MKKFKLILFLVLFTQIANAQVYISSFCGYSLSTNPVVIRNVIMVDTILNSYKTKLSYGKGMNLGIGVGYKLNTNIAIELSVNTQVFTKSDYDNDWTQYYNLNANYLMLSGISGEGSILNRSIQIAPLFIYTVKVNKIEPFVKVGVNFIDTQCFQHHYYKGNPNSSFLELQNSHETDYKITGGWNIGFRGACGARLQVNQYLAVYGELMTVITNYNYLKSEVITNKVGGEDKLSTIENKVTEFEDNSGLVDYSHIAFNIGIRYSLLRN